MRHRQHHIWHDKTADGQELGAGVNPMWHAKNLEHNVMPEYAEYVGLTPDDDPSDELHSLYVRHWDDTTKTSWLWNESKDVYLSTFDTESLDAVARYVIAKGAGGVMIWELAGDYACPENVTARDPCVMGYTMTNRLHQWMVNAGPYGASPTPVARLASVSFAPWRDSARSDSPGGWRARRAYR